MDVVALFESLARAEGDANSYTVAPFPGHPSARVGKDAFGHACILFPNMIRNAGEMLPPVVLKHLQVRHGVACDVEGPEGSRRGRYSIIKCVEAEPELAQYFLRAIGAVLPVVGASPTVGEVRVVVDRLIELFRALALPQRKTAQGLWAELLLICSSPNPEAMLRSWHIGRYDLHDFSMGEKRLEVKACNRGERMHRFTLDQLVSAECKITIASLFVDPHPHGQSVLDLCEKIRSRVKDIELIRKLDQLVAATLGKGWSEGLAVTFDAENALRSLQFYAAGVVPCVTLPIPNDVSDVRFAAVLDSAPAISPPNLQDDELLAVAAPAEAARDKW